MKNSVVCVLNGFYSMDLVNVVMILMSISIE